MKRNYQIVEEKQTGIPCAHIDLRDIWELVEYLASHRIVANYDFHDNRFIVRFPRLAVAAAQALLDQWSHAGVPL